jgi:peptide/nickel transport system permease protein
MSTRFVARRLLQAAITIALIVVLNFLLFRAMPGSPDRMLARNPNVSPEAIQQIRARWGIDKPLFPDQLVAYIAATARGDLGNAFAGSGRRCCCSGWAS